MNKDTNKDTIDVKGLRNKDAVLMLVVNNGMAERQIIGGTELTIKAALGVLINEVAKGLDLHPMELLIQLVKAQVEVDFELENELPIEDIERMFERHK